MNTDQTGWERARLIPISGIKGDTEQETRATSALLAVMTAVPDLRKSLLGDVGAPADRLAAFTKVTFDDDDGSVRPDGVLEIVRAGQHWIALVEVKTGRSTLNADQVEKYVRLAGREGFDAVITISNEFVAPSAPHPVQLPGRVARQTKLIHWSWAHVLTSAVILRKRHQVSDPEQSWLLDELIRYLDDERSGALFFEGFGRHWVSIRGAARAGTLRRGDDGLVPLLVSWTLRLR